MCKMFSDKAEGITNMVKSIALFLICHESKMFSSFTRRSRRSASPSMAAGRGGASVTQTSAATIRRTSVRSAARTTTETSSTSAATDSSTEASARAVLGVRASMTSLTPTSTLWGRRRGRRRSATKLICPNCYDYC